MNLTVFGKIYVDTWYLKDGGLGNEIDELENQLEGRGRNDREQLR